MNYNKLTEKSMQAIQSAQSLAREYGNPELTEIHLLYALLTQENALLPQILRSCGVEGTSFENAVLTALQSLPKQSGGQLYAEAELTSALDDAEKKAQQMNDEYDRLAEELRRLKQGK
jgi:ATP-dependent Clp protease ATP-binding subunit ClpB